VTPQLPEGVRLLAFERIDSTNDHAKRLAESGEAGPSAVWARAQTAGRGRRGRHWSSPEGNLYASLLIQPGRPIAEAAQLSFAAGLAAAEAIEGLLAEGERTRLKWPNDVLIGGAKVAGLLLEAGSTPAGTPWLVIGVGINLRSHPADTRYPATDVGERGGRPEAEEALARFVRAFLPLWREWRQAGFEPIRRRWLARAEGVGGPIQVKLEGEVLTGVFDDVDGNGALLLTAAEGRRAIAAGEIFFGRG
jgi:BirA family biotin operon repressor/biotin-[acetyl-CoA-carboxylase] ligase